ncbi:carbohydrate ABC transporter permease [Kineococcus aurantiacus]|uniref:Multiple sugar transport system permease protein n=1 Tax=Kineococcus aurantiacus TaxID=37633 RepID=A0A7Y9J1J4_9ACTN|nr:carbohydrate ABC transporter permease [Kineococcus aurantiacus]NYD23211.1 multiple sugar transport system permease protein [Kineococcus aurantiacus]
MATLTRAGRPQDLRVRRTGTGGAPAAGRAETRTKLTLYWLGGTLAALVFLVPLAWSVLRSFQSNDAIVATDPSARDLFSLTTANFSALFSSDLDILRSVGNSLVVAISTAVLTAVVATLAGYGFGRFRFRGRNVLFGVVVVTMMVPFQAIITPLYLQMNAMGLTDSRLGLVLFYTTVNLPFGVFVMRNAFETIPAEIEDSARVDGAGTMRALVSVLRPMLIPGMATSALYAFLASWTEFLGALTFLTDDRLYTLPLSLVNLQSGAYGAVNYGYLVAGAVVAMVPCVVLYVALQRFYVAGLASGAVKG